MAFFNNIKKSALIIAPFPPSSFSAAPQSAQLVHCLDNAGIQVETVSAIGPAYCKKLLHFGPKRRFEPVLAQLLGGKHEITVLYPQALGFGQISPQSRKTKLIEDFRRVKLVAKMAFKKPKIVIANPTGLPIIPRFVIFSIIITARIMRPNAVRLVRKSGRSTILATKILCKHQDVPDITLAEETLFRLAGKADNIRLTPTWFSKAVANAPKDDTLGQDLATIRAVIAQLAPLPMPFQNSLETPTSGRIFDRVDERRHSVPASRFMQHLRRKFRLESQFQLSNNEGRLALLRWYMHDAPTLTNHPMPLLATVFDSFRADCKTRADLGSVAGLQQPDTRDVILPAYLLALHRCYPEKYAKFQLGTNTGRIAFAFQITVDHSRFQMGTDFLGKSLNAYFSAGIGGDSSNITRFELFCAVLAHAPANVQKCLYAPWRSNYLSLWFSKLAQSGYPLLENFASSPMQLRSDGLTITGTMSGETGLGRNQKMSSNALKSIQTSKPVFLHHANADDIPSQVCQNNHPGGFHIGYLLWELDKLPKSHLLAKRYLDEIWVPSRFVQNIYQSAYKKPVTMIGKGFDLPDVAPMDLSYYGIGKGKTVFLCCFDMHSSVARKNPLAAVKAFQAAFPRQQNVRFILKTTPPPKNHWGDPTGQMASIQKLMARDNRIILDQRMLTFAELLSLIRAADCTVSSHRAEGFGYFPAYALKYAKPVIATNYSGTTDFCTAQTAFPVGYDLCDVHKSESIYPVMGAKWAEINQTQLANAMQKVQSDLSAALQRGLMGQALMQDYYSADALAKRYHDRLSELGLVKAGLTPRFYNVPALHAKPRPIGRARNLSPVGKP